AEEAEAVAAPDAAALLGLEPGDLEAELEPRIVRCGPVFPLIGVRDLAALRRVRVDLEVQRRLGVPGFPFAFRRGGYSPDADFAARMQFFDGIGLREDPATGSANAAFAAYLARRGARGRRVVEQGFEIGRPSRIHLEIGDAIAVGGRVQPVAEGRLHG